MKVPCSVIQDLLPLYHDSVCSPESCALIEEHLKDCEACQEEFHKLEESPLPRAVKEEEEHKSQGLKKVKRTLRRRWVKVTAAALAAVIALSIPLGMWVAVPVFSEPISTLESIKEQDGFLYAAFTAEHGIETAYIPASDKEDSPGTIVVLSSYFSAVMWLEDIWRDMTTPPFSSLPAQADICLKKDEFWLEQEAKRHREFDYDGDGVIDKIDDSITTDVMEEFYFPGGDVVAVYYYTGLNHGIWQKKDSELCEDLDRHGTLLWTAENGVVYP